MDRSSPVIAADNTSISVTASRLPAWSFPFLAGGLSGAAAAFVGQPFDTLKVRMQTGWTVKGASPTTAVDYLKLTMKHEGASGLFKGIGPQIGSQLLATGLLFGIQDCFRTSLARSTGASRDDLRVIATAGFAAGATLAVVTCPMELLKVDLQACTGPAAVSSGASLAACRAGGGSAAVLASGPSGHAVSSMVRSIGTANRIISQYGAGALYTGVGLTSMRCAVGNFAYFGLYEFLQRTDASERTMAKNGVYGALAGTAYWLACYPLDLLKSKEQCKLIENSASGGIKPVPWRYMASRAVEKSIGVKVREMYKGIGVTLLRGVPVSAVGWMVFGLCQDTFGIRA